MPEVGAMGRAKIAISLDKVTLQRLDRSRLARECARLDPDFEKALADESLSSDVAEW